MLCLNLIHFDRFIDAAVFEFDVYRIFLIGKYVDKYISIGLGCLQIFTDHTKKKKKPLGIFRGRGSPIGGGDGAGLWVPVGDRGAGTGSISLSGIGDGECSPRPVAIPKFNQTHFYIQVVPNKILM
ncbi:unnamed protein product [Camellia sinensis]